MKGETGSPGFKGEKGEPGGGYYDPHYGTGGPPGERGPPVRSHHHKRKALRCQFMLKEIIPSCLCPIRAQKVTPSLVPKALRGHLVIQVEAMMGNPDHQDHLDLQEQP